MGPVSRYRRLWLPELIVLIVVAVLGTLAFWLTDLDITAARPFHHPTSADPWPIDNQPLWRFSYRSAPWVTGSLALAGAVALVAGAVRVNSRRFRLHGLFLLLSVAVGPGLIVNGILKDHWGRPRPRQIVELGGRLEYAPPLLPVGDHGKSFPCGHCSVGYLYSAGWWLWRRRHPVYAHASLAVGLVLGTLLGIGRMAAGGHFLSDVLWSGLIAFGVAHALYFYVLRIPAREDSRASVFPAIERSPRLRAAAILGASLLGASVVAGGMLASAHYQDLSRTVALADFPVRPRTLDVEVSVLDVELEIVDAPPVAISSGGYVHGFGLPTNRITAEWWCDNAPAPVLHYRLRARGWFTDIDGVARLAIPAVAFDRIAVRVERGDIVVTDRRAPRAAGMPPSPVLDLQTADGRILAPTSAIVP